MTSFFKEFLYFIILFLQLQLKLLAKSSYKLHYLVKKDALANEGDTIKQSFPEIDLTDLPILKK